MTDSARAHARSEGPIAAHVETRSHAGFWGLVLGCIGVVYGDIGTSPLYALRGSVLAAGGTAEGGGRDVILVVVSLVLWALLILVALASELLLLRGVIHGQ